MNSSTWVHAHFPRSPIPCPLSSGAEPFLNTILTVIWCRTLSFPYVLSLSPQLRNTWCLGLCYISSIYLGGLPYSLLLLGSIATSQQIPKCKPACMPSRGHQEKKPHPSCHCNQLQPPVFPAPGSTPLAGARLVPEKWSCGRPIVWPAFDNPQGLTWLNSHQNPCFEAS